jgi:hypothetical protein
LVDDNHRDKGKTGYGHNQIIFLFFFPDELHLSSVLLGYFPGFNVFCRATLMGLTLKALKTEEADTGLHW